MKHFNLILCPVDFSQNSYHAIEQASFLAQLFKVNLTLVHVIHNILPESLGVIRGDDLNSQKAIEDAQEQARTLLREAKQKYVPYAITCKSSIRHGNISKGILQEAEEKEASLIFMASEGNNGSSLLGGVTREVVEGSSCPVLTYHHAFDRKGFRKILVPLEPSMSLEEHSRYLSELFSMMSPNIHLLSVVSPEASDAQREEILQHLATGTALLHEKGLTDVTPEVVVSEDAAAAVSAYAHDHDCHLIMMHGFHPQGEVASNSHSLTGTLIRSLRRPIMTLGNFSGGRTQPVGV